MAKRGLLVNPYLRARFWKRAEYGFGEYGFKHRTQWVFRGSLSSGERTQWVPLSLLFVWQSELTEFFEELTEFAPELSEAQWVLFSETVLSKQYSARFLRFFKLMLAIFLGKMTWIRKILLPLIEISFFRDGVEWELAKGWRESSCQWGSGLMPT